VRARYHHKIESCVVPESGQRFNGEDFRMLLKPCVYLFMKDGSPLYIGMSKNGIARPAGANHRQFAAREECDEVLIYPCNSERDAKYLEELLICKTKPKYNRNKFTSFAAILLGNRRVYAGPKPQLT
jgi:excinuclease UvrABC nuclease subunit